MIKQLVATLLVHYYHHKSYHYAITATLRELGAAIAFAVAVAIVTVVYVIL
jgi:hypothetical protein